MPYDYNENYSYRATTFIDGEGNTKYRAVVGEGSQTNPMVTAIFLPPNYATGSILNIPVTTTISPILTLDVRGIDSCYFLIKNVGSVPLSVFRIETQVEPNSQFWETHAQTASDFTTNTGEALNNSMKVVVRASPSPFNLSNGSFSFLTLNIPYYGGLRLVAACSSGNTTLNIEGCHKWAVSRPPEGFVS